MPASALEARTSDGRYRVVTDDARRELLVQAADSGDSLRRIPLRDASRRAGELAWIIDLPKRQSLLAGFAALPEAWELPYRRGAEPVYDGLVHDYRMGEGIAESGPLPVRRIPLAAPMPQPTPDERQIHVTYPDPARPGKHAVLNLDVRRVIGHVDPPAPVVAQGGTRPASGPGAAPGGPAAGMEPQRIERLQVIGAASRVDQAIEDVPATVSVLEREELFRDVAGSLRDVFRYEPGISMDNSATRFGLGSINIRGLEGNRVQMTVDGIRLPESYRVGSFSNASRNALGLGLLKRVEIVRGPASAIHGSDALAGVVAFTTLDPATYLAAGKGFGGEAFAGYASADRSLQRGAAIAIDVRGTQLLIGAERTDGEETANQGNVGGTGANRTEPNPQDKRGESQLVKWIVPTAAGWRYTITADRYAQDVKTDVLSLNPQSSRTVGLSGDDRARRTRYSAEARGTGVGPFDRLSLTAYAQDSLTQQDTAEVRANTTAVCLSAPGNVRCLREPRFRYEAEEAGVVAIGESRPRWFGLAHEVVTGLEFSRTRMTEQRDGRQTNLNTGEVSTVVGGESMPTRDFPVTDTGRFGAFVQDSIVSGDRRMTWIPGVRLDAFRLRPQEDPIFASGNPGRSVASLSDQALSPKLGLLFRATEALTWTGQIATGFRAPPAADLNIGLTSLPAGYTVIPNPDLTSERSLGAELGARWVNGQVAATIAAYYTSYDDLIVSRAPLPCPGDPRCVPGATGTFQSQNISSARIYGIEGRLAWRPARGWTLQAAFALPRGDDTDKNQPLNTMDPPKLVLGLAFERSSWGANLHLTHAWEQTRIDSTSRVTFVPPSWTTADLTAWVKPVPSLEIAAGVFNLADEKYWLWSDVRGLVNLSSGIDRYTQPGRTYGVNARWSF